MVVSTSFWSWLLNVSFWNTQLPSFWDVNALWLCWKFMGVLSFWFWSLFFWNMSFFVLSLMRSFVAQFFFFIFQDIVWLVKSSWCVQCCSIHQFYWVSDRCRSGFALRWFFFSEKSCRYKLVVFTSFWSWLVNVSSILTSLKYTATFFGVVNALWVCWQFMGALSFDFHLCFSEICHFLCLSLMRSFVVHFFSFFRIFCGYLSHLDVFIVVPFISSSGLAIVAEANLRCGDFCQTFVVFINWKLELIMFFHLLMLPGSAFF